MKIIFIFKCKSNKQSDLSIDIVPVCELVNFKGCIWSSEMGYRSISAMA